MTSVRLLSVFAFTSLCLTLPAVASVVLFGGNSAAPPSSGADAAVYAFLQNRYGAANVDYTQTNAPAGTETGYAVFVISSTPGSGDIRNKWHNSATPIVNYEEAVADNGTGEFSITTGRDKDDNATTLSIDITTIHPVITAGFSLGQTVTISSGMSAGGNSGLWWSSGTQAPGAVSYAEQTGNSARGWITTVDTGGTLLNASTAPARRVMMGMLDNSFNFMTADGQQLFGQAVDWAGNISPIPEPSTFAFLGLGGLAILLRRRR